ncbi:MAG: hypothetical protein OEL53_06635 [Rhodospirillales bacterium]|nr:hypothetical protein [Rhodospirillales bacterium]
MTTITFDTLKFSERLKAGGFTTEQAHAAAEAFAEATGGELVTRDYLDAKLSDAKADILKWMFTTALAQAGVIVAVLKLI